MEQRGKPIDPHSTNGDLSTMVDVDDEKGLKQLAWAIYDGVLLPGDPLQLQGQHDWAWIIVHSYCLVFQGEYDLEQCIHALQHPSMLSRL